VIVDVERTIQVPPYAEHVESFEATPVCGKDFCDRCGACLHCYDDPSCDERYGSCWWVLDIDDDAERIRELRDVSSR
jgi:hypothetical protein